LDREAKTWCKHIKDHDLLFFFLTIFLVREGDELLLVLLSLAGRHGVWCKWAN
jgi:high-affinity Fe2+/Pb2+ permease